MSMIFCGDCALPFDTKVDVSEIRVLFDGNIGIANLEGAILVDAAETDLYRFDDKFSLYSSPAVISLLKSLNIKYVTLLNNHALDYKPDIRRTISLLNDNGIKALGPDNPDVLSFSYEGRDVLLMSFAFGGCLHNYKRPGTQHIVAAVTALREAHPLALICLFPHWGLEMDTLPEPADRALAHQLIDAGADLIVGHHSHILQPFEIYKGKYIVYSLGNFILPQIKYGRRRLFFRNDGVLKMAVAEFDGVMVKLHRLKFDKDDNKMMIDGSAMPIPEINAAMSDSEYKRMYIESRGRMHYLKNARWTNGRYAERNRHLRMDVVHRLRRVLIKLNLHNPYK